MPSTSVEDQDLQDMARMARGNDAALSALMTRHAEKIYQYLLRSLQNEDDAADLAQETFVKLYQNRAKFDPRQKFTSWLYAIASNLVRDRFRWRARHPQVSLDAETAEPGASYKDLIRAEGDAPDEALAGAERAAAVHEAVANLPEELHQPLILAVYEGLPQADIAQILGCSVKAVETRIYRARNHLRSALSRELPAHSR